MATGAEILSYRGDAGLGLGANPEITAYSGKEDLNPINQAAQQALLLNQQQNLDLYRQKVSDRDNLLNMLATDQVAAGDILPEYKKYYDDAEKRTQDAYLKWGGDFNNKEGYRKYKETLQDLKDITTQAQAKTLGLKSLKNDFAKTYPNALPDDLAQFDNFYKTQEKKGFWDAVDPYVKGYDWDLKNVTTAAQNTKTYTDPKNQLMQITETFPDYTKTVDTYTKYFSTPKGYADITGYLNSISALPNAPKYIAEANRILANINQQRGLQPTDIDYVKPIEGYVDNTGKLMFNEPLSDVTAKLAIAGNPNVTRSSVFNKNLGDYKIDKEKNAIGWANVKLGNRKLDQDQKEKQDAAQSILRLGIGILNSGNTPENTITYYDPTTKTNKQAFVMSDPTLLKQFGTVDKDGKTTNIPNQVRFDPKTNEAQLVYFQKDPDTGQEITYANGGHKIEIKTLTEKDWLRQLAKGTYGEAKAGDIFGETERILQDNGGSLFELSKKINGGKADKNTEQETVSVSDIDGNVDITTLKDGKYKIKQNGKIATIKGGKLVNLE